jgi:hypothetical protein
MQTGWNGGLQQSTLTFITFCLLYCITHWPFISLTAKTNQLLQHYSHYRYHSSQGKKHFFLHSVKYSSEWKMFQTKILRWIKSKITPCISILCKPFLRNLIKFNWCLCKMRGCKWLVHVKIKLAIQLPLWIPKYQISQDSSSSFRDKTHF